MDKVIQKIGIPCIIMIAGSLGYSMLNTMHMQSWIIELWKAITFFSMGLSLNTYKKKRSSAWVGKLIISFVMFYYIGMQLGYIPANQVTIILRILGLTSPVIAVPLVYLLCGFLFFD